MTLAINNPNLTPQQPDYAQQSYDYQWAQTQTAISGLNAALGAVIAGLPTTVVTSITDLSEATGALTFNGPAVQQSGLTFTFGFPGGLILTFQTYTDPLANVTVTAFCSLMLSNSNSVSFVLPLAVRNPNTFFLVGTNFNAAVPVVSAGADTIQTNEGRGHVLYASDGVSTWYNVLSINSP